MEALTDDFQMQFPFVCGGLERNPSCFCQQTGSWPQRQTLDMAGGAGRQLTKLRLKVKLAETTGRTEQGSQVTVDGETRFRYG